MSNRDVFVEQAQARLNEWGAKINLLNAEAERSKADVKADAYKRIEDLKTMRERLERRVEDVKREAAREWEDLKIGVERAEHDLKTAIEDVSSLFKS